MNIDVQKKPKAKGPIFMANHTGDVVADVKSYYTNDKSRYYLICYNSAEKKYYLVSFYTGQMVKCWGGELSDEYQLVPDAKLSIF